MTNSLAKRAALYIGILAFALVLLLFLGAGQASADEVNVTGDITNDTTWTSGNVYNLNTTVYVTNNSVLTIQSDVTVIAQGYFWFYVDSGSELVVMGNETHPVIFTCNESAVSSWIGLYFNPGSSGSLTNLHLEKAVYGMYLYNTTVSIDSLSVYDCGYGIFGEYYGDVVAEQVIELQFNDVHMEGIWWNALVLNQYNGSLMVTLDGWDIKDSNSASYLYATNYYGTGTVDLDILNSNFDNVYYQIAYVDADVVDINIADTSINNTEYYVIYAEDYYSVSVLNIDLSNVSITDVYQLVYANNYNGSIGITMDGVMADGFSYGIYGYAYGGAVDISVMNSEFSNMWSEGAVFYTNSYLGDGTVVLQDTSFDGVFGVLEYYANNGSLDVTLDGVTTNNTYFLAILEAEDFFGTGTVDLAITGSWFTNSYAGLQVQADMIGEVTISDSEISNLWGGFFIPTESVLEAPAMLPLMPIGLIMEAGSGDLAVTLEDVAFNDLAIGVIGMALNGSASLTMTGVVSNNTMLVVGLMAQDFFGTGTIDAMIADCSFSYTEMAVMLQGNLIGSVSVTDTFAAGMYTIDTLQPGTAFDIIGYEEGGMTTLVFDHVTAEGFSTVFYVEVYNDLDLTIDSVVTNDTGTVGYFAAVNTGQNATMDISVVNSSFSNTTTGLVFITNIMDPDFSLLGTNTFTNVFGQSLIINADLGDVVMNFEQFVMTNGGGISVHLGFGNIEVNVIDSVMDCSGYGTILDLIVNSNALDNGFITLNVMNSTLSDAENGIRTWSEELVIVAMDDVNFVNLEGTALHFDVRSTTSTDRVLTIALNNVMGENIVGGLFVYLNDGSLDLSLDNVALETGWFGVHVEASCQLPDDLSVIDMVVTDSVFDGGAYGIYALAVNGGTAVITGSQFLGHSEVGYWFDSLYGEMNVEITESVFDGSSAADITVYTVEEVENTFQLIGRNHWTMGVDAWTGGSAWIDLPFDFYYNGMEYSSVYLHEDGWIGFEEGQEIMPVGVTDLLYNYEQFFGYKVAADNSSVMFHWYASEWYSGSSLSLVFQVVLFADGTIQFNYANMDSYSYDVEFGLVTDDDMIYDLSYLYGIEKWEADWMAFLFTPLPISYGMGALLSMDEGNISAVITNNTVTSYYDGGIAVRSLDGGMDIEVTGNDFNKIVGYEFASLDLYNHNGESDVTLADNSFEMIWGLAINLYMSSTHGGVKNVDMSDSVFNKVGYVLYSVIEVYENTGRTGNDTLDVTVNFQNNVLTDAFGLVCWINMYLYDEVDWTVNVEQTMTNNVMVQENYMGSWPFPAFHPISSGLGSSVYIQQTGEDANSITLEQTATVTGNHIEVPGYSGIDIGNIVTNYYGDTTRNAAIDISDNMVNITGEYGIYVWSEMYTGAGNVADDVSIIIENNIINDGSQSIDAISVYLSVDSIQGIDYDQSGDADITAYVSIADNLVEGAWKGIDSSIWYYQDNVAGDWNVALTSHMDRNRMLNVSTAIDAYMYVGSYFSGNYWPPENETAVANLVLDYLYTVDDNIIVCAYNPYHWEEIIYVDIEYWAWIESGTPAIAANAKAWITGTLSISGNDITQIEGYVSGIYLYHWLGAQTNSWIWVDVDVAVEDNKLLVTWEGDGPGPSPDVAIEIYSEVDVRSHDYVAVPAWAIVDMVWSITGNEVDSGFLNGIVVFEDITLDEGMSCLDYAVSWDISDNTLMNIKEYGISYELSRNEDTVGTIDMNVAVDIDDNVISMFIGPSNSAGIYLDSWYYTDNWEYWYDQIGNHTFVASVSGNTVSDAYIGLEIYGTLYFDVPEDYELAEGEMLYTYVNDITVEDNYINGSWYGMYLYDAITVRNNIVECGIGDEIYGIYWYEAEGELVGNTITAEIGVYVYYLHNWLAQDNLVQFGATGIYIYSYDYEEMTDGAIIDNVITALENPFLPWSSYGIELYDVPNVLISGNVISGADYGLDLYYVWNVTIVDNEISDASEYGIYVYDAWLIWIESNTVTGCGDGLHISSYVEDIVVGNNTFMENSYGIYMYEEVHRMVLWNNVFIDNEYGTDIYSYLYMEAVWYVDAQCQSTRSDLEFNGPVYVLAGGSMVLEDIELYVRGGLTVDEGGLLSMSSVYVDECWFIDVAGTFWASLSVFEWTDVNLGPTAEAEIRTSTFYYSEMLVDGSAPVIADNLFVGYGEEYGIVVKNGAAPSIVSNVIALYAVGIYANGMDMGGIYDNLIVGNFMAGLLAEDCTGAIHDNIFLLNKVEILLRNSDVSVEDNEIGYTNMFQVIANYAPILGHFVNLSGPDSEVTTADPQAAMDAILSSSWSDIGSWVKAHNGIWAEGSVVRTSGNVYGMLNYALYAVDSEIHFADDIRTIVLTVPHAQEGMTYNYSLNIYTLNGLYAARSQVWVDGSTIEVLDDALVFEASEAWVEGATLMAGDFDYLIFGGSNVYNIATTYTKAKVMDSHSLNEGTWLTLTAMDKGEAAANVSVVIKNAKGEIVYEGVTDAEGKVRVLLIQYSYTSAGKDDGFNPYTITADFESGEKSMDVVLNQSYQDVIIEGEEESDMGAILAVVGVLVIILLIVAAVVVMRRRK